MPHPKKRKNNKGLGKGKTSVTEYSSDGSVFHAEGTDFVRTNTGYEMRNVKGFFSFPKDPKPVGKPMPKNKF